MEGSILNTLLRSRLKFFALVATLFVALGLMAIPSSSVGAHHPTVSGWAECVEGQWNWHVHWEVSNGNWGNQVMTITSTSRSVAGFGTGTTVSPDGFVEGTENLPGSTSGTITLSVSASWPNGVTATRSGDVNLPEGGCEPPPPAGENWARASARAFCTGNGTGEYVISFSSSDPDTVQIQSVPADFPLTGELPEVEKKVQYFFYFSSEDKDEPKLVNSEVTIPAASECDHDDGGGEETVSEYTFPCLAPSWGNVFAARWFWSDGTTTMVGSWQFFASKELTLTYNSVHPGDKFEFYRFPSDVSLDEARHMDPQSNAEYIGVSTVNEFVAGHQGSCSVDGGGETTTETDSTVNTNVVEGSGEVTLNVDCEGSVYLDSSIFLAYEVVFFKGDYYYYSKGSGSSLGSYVLNGSRYFFTLAPSGGGTWIGSVPTDAGITEVTVYLVGFPPVTVPVSFTHCGEVVEHGSVSVLEATTGNLGPWDPLVKIAGEFSGFYVLVNGEPVGARIYMPGDEITDVDPNGKSLTFTVPAQCVFYRIMENTSLTDDLSIQVDGTIHDIDESGTWLLVQGSSCNYDPTHQTFMPVFGQTLAGIMFATRPLGFVGNVYGPNGEVAWFRDFYGSDMIVAGHVYEATWMK